MKKLVELTAWKMIPPKPYGLFHIMFFIIGMVFCIYFAKKFKNTDDKQNKKILFFTGLFLLIIEIYKEFFYYYVVNIGHYDFSIFPFQLCDVPMFICLILPFIKNKKLEMGMYDFMVSYNLLGGLIALIEPSSLCRPYLMMTIHGFLWHIILVFIGLYLACSGRCLKNKSSFKNSFYVYLALCFIALVINFSLSKISGGTINAFYLGPAITPVVIFKDIALKFGWFVNMIIYILMVTLGAYLIYNFLYNFNKYKKGVKEFVSKWKRTQS